MSVSNGQPANEDTFNNAFVSKTAASTVTAVVTLDEAASGGTIANTQQAINDNTTGVAANAANIATNTGNIATNTADISNLQTSTKFNNFSGTVDPTVSNDNTESYEVGSFWLNVTGERLFQCTDNSTGAAVWIRIDNLKFNQTTIDPTVSDDDTQGYETDSLWFNQTSGALFVCQSASTGAAIWNQTAGGAAGGAAAGNLAINGGFDHSWRVALSAFSSTATPDIYLNKWLSSYDVAHTVNPVVSKQVDSPNNKTKYCISYTQTAALSTDSVITTHRMESVFARSIAGEAASLSFWVKSGQHQDIDIEIYTANAEDNFAAVTSVTTSNQTFTANNTWQEITLENVSIPAAATNGLEVRLILTNAASTGVSFTSRIAQFSIVKGDTAQEFSHFGGSYHDDMKGCERTQAKNVDVDTLPGQGGLSGCPTFVAQSNTQATGTCMFPSRMRAIPTVTIYGSGGTAGQAHRRNVGDLAATVFEFNESGIGRLAGSWANNDNITFHYFAMAEL